MRTLSGRTGFILWFSALLLTVAAQTVCYAT